MTDIERLYTESFITEPFAAKLNIVNREWDTLNSQVAAEIRCGVDHLTKNEGSIITSGKVNRILQETFENAGCLPHRTSIVTHGMREYSFPLARVIDDTNGTIGFLRCSPQFEKQLITMATKKGYVQAAPSLRPGEIDATHIPYLHQMDVEIPFSSSITSFEEAAHITSSLIGQAVRNALVQSGIDLAPTIRLTYDEAMERYGSPNPYLAESGDAQAHLAIIEKPPLFSVKDGTIDTTILPMALPIFQNSEELQRFLSGQMKGDELCALRVYGYDLIASSGDVWVNDKKGGREGIEIAGGSVRINNPELQSLIFSMVRKEHIKTFLPLIKLLDHFNGSGIFTAGGAVGTERISMIASRTKYANDILSMPWSEDGKPPFHGLVE